MKNTILLDTYNCPEEERTWDKFEEIMATELFDGLRKFLLQGTFGSWRGAQRAGSIIKNYADLCGAWRDCNFVKVYTENGHFYIDACHNDGTNHYELKELNDRGIAYLAHNEAYMHKSALHDTLWTRAYSKRVTVSVDPQPNMHSFLQEAIREEVKRDERVFSVLG